MICYVLAVEIRKEIWSQSVGSLVLKLKIQNGPGKSHLIGYAVEL